MVKSYAPKAINFQTAEYVREPKNIFVKKVILNSKYQFHLLKGYLIYITSYLIQYLYTLY